MHRRLTLTAARAAHLLAWLSLLPSAVTPAAAAAAPHTPDTHSAHATEAAHAAQADASAEPAPSPTGCPPGLPPATRCLAGQDWLGAHYLMAVPPGWNGTLVLHAHGGPHLGEPRAEQVRQDLQRWSVFPRVGYAWAASSYRQGGVAVGAAAQDTERLRRIFVRHVAEPRHTLLHGQSWGASVAARGAELFTQDLPYDGVLLTSGVLAGGTRAYDFRLDLRVVYQYLCRNHPRPGEADYPLWMGLPQGGVMNGPDLRQRLDECLGLGHPAAQRTPEQARRLRTLTAVLRIPEGSVQNHMYWATWHFQDIARRYHWQPVFGNQGAAYTGSDDDAALNRAVARYPADPQAVAAFAADTDPQGRIPVPVLSAHAIHDATAFVEMQHRFAQTMREAGRASLLVQAFTSDRDHSDWSDASYVALAGALVAWAQGGERPSPQAIAQRCAEAAKRLASACRFEPGYTPAPLESRVAPRIRP